MYQNLKDILSKTKSSIRITLGLTDSMTYHNVKDINELASEIKSCYKTKILKDIVEKIRDIHDVDKELGREVDADEYHQKDLMRRVDDIAESQVNTENHFCVSAFVISLVSFLFVQVCSHSLFPVWIWNS